MRSSSSRTRATRATPATTPFTTNGGGATIRLPEAQIDHALKQPMRMLHVTPERPRTCGEHLHQHKPCRRRLVADLAQKRLQRTCEPALPVALRDVRQGDAPRYMSHRLVIRGEKALTLALREQLIDRARGDSASALS